MVDWLIKANIDHLSIEKCISSIMNSLYRGKEVDGFWAGCLLMAVEVGRYIGISYGKRVCRLCECGEVED